MKFGTHIHGSQRMMTLTNFGDSLTFPVQLLSSFVVGQSKYLNYCLTEWNTIFSRHLYGPQSMSPNVFSDPVLFP